MSRPSRPRILTQGILAQAILAQGIPGQEILAEGILAQAILAQRIPARRCEVRVTWDHYESRGASHGSEHARARRSWATRHQPSATSPPSSACGAASPSSQWAHGYTFTTTTTTTTTTTLLAMLPATPRLQAGLFGSGSSSHRCRAHLCAPLRPTQRGRLVDPLPAGTGPHAGTQAPCVLCVGDAGSRGWVSTRGIPAHMLFPSPGAGPSERPGGG